jgi:hypothetical protein
MGHDTTGEALTTTIRQLLMDKFDVEGEPLFQAIEHTMKEDTDQALFTESNQEICEHILDDIEIWMKQKFEHADDPKAYRECDNMKMFATTPDTSKIRSICEKGCNFFLRSETKRGNG